MLTEVVEGLVLALALCFMYGATIRALPCQGLTRQVAAGLLFGAFCVLDMLGPATPRPGLLFDGRVVVLSMAALFGGPLAGSIALVMAAVWHWRTEGPGALPSVALMAVSVALGLLLRQVRLRRRLQIGFPMLLVLGVLLHLTVLASHVFLLSQDARHDHFTNGGVADLLVFLTGTVLLGLLLRAVESRAVTEQALTDSSARLQAIASSMPGVLVLLDARGVCVETLSARSPSQGLPPAGPGLGQRMQDLLTAEAAQRMTELIEQALASGQPQSLDYRLETASGTRHWEGRLQSLNTSAPGRAALLFLARDITGQRPDDSAARESEPRFRSLLRDLPSISVQGYLADGTTTYWNQAAEQLYGYTRQEAIGRNLLDLIIPASMHDAVRGEMQAMFASGISIPAAEVRLQRKDGTLVDVYSSHAYVAIAGQAPEMFCIDIDISRRKSAEEEARYLALYDALTRLPNRRLLTDRLQQVMASSERSGLQAAVLFLDLDNFKILNDSRGHAVGDLLLVEVAHRLQAGVREHDTVARLGGDEFVVVLHNLSSNESEAASQVRAVGEQIVAALRQPYNLSGHQQHMTVSMGATLLHDRQASIDEVLKQADMAMYRAKDAGRNTLRFFDPDMQEIVNQRALLETQMHDGLRDSQFVLFYQAQVNSWGHVTGAEALVRWHHPTLGLTSPALFIKLAEESGLILELGRWAMQDAMRQQALWRRDPALAHLRLAINVSARQFRQEHFVAQVLQLLADSGADAQCITLELTESLLLQDVENVIDTMRTLKAHGLGFSLDDFGTGYSSLSYLKRLPLDQIKIDQGFVRDALSHPSDAAIAHAIITLADKLGLGVIAEGVETIEQYQFLVSHHCRAFQGYLFGRPEPVQALEQRIRSSDPASERLDVHRA